MRLKLKWLLLLPAVLVGLFLFVRWKSRSELPPKATLTTFADDLQRSLKVRNNSVDAFVFDGQHAVEDALVGQDWHRVNDELRRQGATVIDYDQSSVMITFPKVPMVAGPGAKLLPAIALFRNRPQSADAPDELKVMHAEFMLRSMEPVRSEEWKRAFPKTSSIGIALARPKVLALLPKYESLRNVTLRHSHTRDIPGQKGYISLQFELGNPPDKEERSLNLNYYFATDLEPLPHRYVSWIPFTYERSRDLTAFSQVFGESGESSATRSRFTLRKRGTQDGPPVEPQMPSAVTNRGLEKLRGDITSLDVAQIPALDFKLLERFKKVKTLDVGYIGTLSQAKALAALPALTDIRFRTNSPEVVAQVGTLRNLVSIDLVGAPNQWGKQFTTKTLLPLANLPKIGRFNVVRTNGSGDELVRALSRRNGLRELQLMEKATYTAGALAELKKAKQLHRLWIRGEAIDAKGWAAIAAHSGIEELLISAGKFDTGSLDQIASMPNLKKLILASPKGKIEASSFRNCRKLESLLIFNTTNLTLEKVKEIQNTLGPEFELKD